MEIENKVKIKCNNTERGRIAIATDVLNDIRILLPDELKHEKLTLSKSAQILQHILNYEVINL